MPFGVVIEGTTAHQHNVFECGEIPVTRIIVDFRQNFEILYLRNGPRYKCQNFTTDGGWGSPYDALDILAHSPKNFEKLGDKDFGWVPPAAPKRDILRDGPRVARGVG